MIELSPKRQWATLRKDDSAAFANIIANPVMRTALTYAFAEFGRGGVTPDELNGAKKFIAVFAELSEPAKENKPIPARELSE